MKIEYENAIVENGKMHRMIFHLSELQLFWVVL